MSDKKKGDWTCSCGFNNFGSRMSCKDCGKKRAATTMREGDWMCPHCRCLVFASRSSCFKCKKEKPLTEVVAAAVPSSSSHAQPGEGDREKSRSPPPRDMARYKCCICFENDKETIFKPCMHQACCTECAEKVKSIGNGCPVCRKPIHTVVRVFMT